REFKRCADTWAGVVAGGPQRGRGGACGIERLLRSGRGGGGGGGGARPAAVPGRCRIEDRAGQSPEPQDVRAMCRYLCGPRRRWVSARARRRLLHRPVAPKQMGRTPAAVRPPVEGRRRGSWAGPVAPTGR